jgi:hypothetical protein
LIELVVIDTQYAKDVVAGMYCCAAVDLSAEEECHLAPLVKKRSDIEQIPKRISVFAVIKKKFHCLFAAVD